jgi:hypothetical protein
MWRAAWRTAKVLNDIAEIDEKERTNVAVSKNELPETPSLPDLIGATCISLNLEPWKFEDQPQRKRPALARRNITYL